MNREIEDLIAEREAVLAAVEHFEPITIAWAFERESASSKPLLDFYIGAVKESDLFVLVVGQRVSEPVRAECGAAADYGKPILVFSKAGVRRESQADDLLKSLNLKYDSFVTPAELLQKLRKSLGLHLLSLIRRDEYDGSRPGDRLARLRRAKQTGTSVKIVPMVPRYEYDLFRVDRVGPEAVVFVKQSSSQQVEVPTQRIEDVLTSNEGKNVSVFLNGRLQWVTVRQQWLFFPQKPNTADPLLIGLSKEVSRDFADFPPFPNPGLKLFWIDPKDVPSREIFFDEDGHHLTANGKVLAYIKPGAQIC